MLGLLVPLTCLVSCGPTTPGDYSDAATDAMNDQNYEKALSLYSDLLDWKGEGEVKPEIRFKAARNSVECKIRLGKAKEGVADFTKLKETFSEQMAAPDAYTYAQSVFGALSDAKADFDASLALLAFASENYPEQKEKFQSLADELKKGASDEQRSKLKGLGY